MDEDDFDRFVETCEPLMKPSRDVMWVLVGRTDTNLEKVKRILRQHNLHFDKFWLMYNYKLMQLFGHF